MTVHYRRKGLLLLKSEGSEGTAETLTNADQHHLVHDVSVTPDIQKFVRKPFMADIGVLAPVIGKRASAISGKFEMKGHGNASGTVTDIVEYEPILKAGCFIKELAEFMTIGAITDGPFQDGETITGGTSSATGTVWKDTADGTTTLVFVTLTGTFSTGEVVTGGTSLASATTSSVPADYGNLYRLHSDGGTSLTGALLFKYGTSTNTQVKIAGARCSLLVVADGTGNPVVIEFNLQGKLVAVGEFALTPATNAYDEKQPLPFLGAGVTLSRFGAAGGNSWTPVFSSFRLDCGQDVQPRDDSNDAVGIKSFVCPDFTPTVQIDPELVEESTFDFFDEQVNSYVGQTGFRLGHSPDLGVGRRVEVYVPGVYIDDWDLSGDRAGIQLLNLTLGACKSGVNAAGDRLVTVMTR